MILNDVILLCGVSFRTYAYLQAMIKEGIYPKKCLVLEEIKENCVVKRKNTETDNRYFRVDENLIELMERYGIEYQLLNTKDANSDIVFERLKNITEKYVIYSGYGGCILGERLFRINKKFIHIHAGILPQYRGSTTAYYSILKEDKIGATGIFMNEKIDEGDIILAKSFPIPEDNVDIDYIYEPWVRASVLTEIMKNYLNTEKIEGGKQETNDEETYYIIHPVLKHITLLSLEEKR